GHGLSDALHLVNVGALAAQQIAHLGAPLGRAAAETVDPLGHRQPSIFEKSATASMVARIWFSNFSRLSRRSGLSCTFTVTLSKKASIGARKPAKACIAAEKSSFSNAGCPPRSNSAKRA